MFFGIDITWQHFDLILCNSMSCLANEQNLSESVGGKEAAVDWKSKKY
jgi:hypothetical protein